MYKNDRGGASLITEPVIGIVKSNVDPTRSGKIQVYIARFGKPDADDPTGWYSVSYLSPYAGLTSTPNGPEDGANKSGNGAFVGNPQSYGFWATAPDVGTQVVCIFIDGQPNQGYYIGCAPREGLLHMTPAIGATDNVVPNGTEGDSYGGADRLPGTEINYSNPALKKSVQPHAEAKPIHSYQTSIFQAQGLLRDNVRGPISSSAQRETPSRVFGMSTPGGAIYEGGFNNQTIKAAAKSADKSKLKQIGRTGGHTFVMDDGTVDGADQLVRLRTSGGHQIMMNDSGQALFIIHSNGQSWIELGKEGTIDMYSTNSVNVRTQGDLNFHADRNVNINADKNLNLYGENINIESSKATNQRVGTNFTGYTMGTFTIKVDGAMSQAAGGQASYKSSAETFINGSKVNLNSGEASLTPSKVEPIPKTSHTDTINSPTVGWMYPSPNPLVSITNRAPAHQPWIGSGTGVNVKISSSPTPTSQQTVPGADAVNKSTPSAPTTPTTLREVAAVPSNSAAAGPMTGDTLKASAAQIATNAQSTVANGAAPAGMLSPASGLTAKMAEQAGVIKPGSAEMVSTLVAKGMPLEKALAGVATGAVGVASAVALASNVPKQAEIVTAALVDSTKKLVTTGVLTGNESPAQAAGLALAATTKGFTAVADAVNTGITNVSGLADDIASGKFAGGMADKSIGGIKTSISGITDGIKGKISALGDQVSSLKDDLKTGLQGAFDSVEQSFGKLKAGVPNKLGPATDEDGTPPKTEVTKSAENYESAKAEIDSATDKLFTAKREYRNDPTPDMQAKVQEAEAALSAARQKQVQARSSFLQATVGGVVSGVTDTIGGAIGDIQTSVTAGINSLPGGKAALISITNNSQVAAIGGAVTTAVGLVEKSIGGASSLTSGDIMAKAQAGIEELMGGSTTNIKDKVTGQVTGNLDSLKSGVDGMMAQLQATMTAIPGGAGAVKAAEAAVGTFDKSAIIAKTGQLLGDAKIPLPFFSDSKPPLAEPEKMSAEQSEALTAVIDAQNKLNAVKLNLSIAKSTSSLLPGGQAKIEEATATLQEAEEALASAQTAYSSLIQS